MRIFGVEAGPGFIRVAILEKHLRSSRLVRLAGISLGPQARHSASLGEFMRSLGYDPEKDSLAAVFPGGKVTSRAISTPLKKRAQIAETLPFELESRTPLGADEFVCDFIVSGKSEEATRILATLARNEDVREFLGIFAEAGLDPEMLVPGPLAAVAGLAGGEAEPGASVAVAHGGADGVYLAITGANGAPMMFHTMSIASGGAESVARELDRLQLSVSREEPQIAVSSVALGGWIADYESTAKALQGKLMIPAAPAMIANAPTPETDEPAGGMADGEKTALFLAAVGAAYMAGEVADPVNLRSGPFRYVSRRVGQRREALLAIGLALSALALWAGAFIADGIGMSREHARLKSSIRAIFKTAMPQTQTIVSEKQQLLAELNRIESAVKAMGVTQGRDPFLDIMRDVSAAKPGNVKVDIEELTYEPGRLILAGRTESFEKVDLIKSNIEKLAWVGKARLEKAKAAVAKEGVSFRIEVDVAL